CRAGAAMRDTAAELGAGEAERVAQHPQERRVGRDVDCLTFAVDGETDGGHEGRPLRWNREQRAPAARGMEGGLVRRPAPACQRLARTQTIIGSTGVPSQRCCGCASLGSDEEHRWEEKNESRESSPGSLGAAKLAAETHHV